MHFNADWLQQCSNLKGRFNLLCYHFELKKIEGIVFVIGISAGLCNTKIFFLENIHDTQLNK